jgi:hypothetical protein
LSGPLGPPGSHLILTNITATPVNASGASIAGESEAQQESFYGTLDQTLFGLERSNPFILNINKSASPGGLKSFINSSSDLPISNYIAGLMAPGGLFPGGVELTAGAIITVDFPDGSKAEFVYTPGGNPPYTWNGNAWNSSGQKNLPKRSARQ